MIVYLDTNIVIYAVEMNPAWGLMAATRMAAIQSNGGQLMVSDLTRMESLVGPLKAKDAVLEGDFRAFFAGSEIQVVPITAAVCDQAALIRAATRFKPMDALQLAAAAEHGADVFLTNDTRLNSFTGLTVEVLA